MSTSSQHIAVIGAGIVGICCAAVLNRRGLSVTLIDKDQPCSGTSRGNAGAIAIAETMPLASPGIITKAPLWLLDPLGPLSISPSYLPRLLPWLYRFWRASSVSQVRRSAESLSTLLDLSVPAWQRMAADAGVPHKLRTLGEIHVYQGQRQFESAQWAWAIRRELGVKFDPVSHHEIKTLEPALCDSFSHGFHVPDWIQVTDPFELGEDVASHACAKGVCFRQGTVLEVTRSPGGSEVLLDDGSSVACSQVVLAAGAWSHRLAKKWGDDFPLETERGYNTTFPAPNMELKQQITFAAHGFVMSPLSSGLRIGGAVELAGLEKPPNFQRAKDMVTKAQKFLPSLVPGNGVEWMGYRPSLPDSLPVIGRSTSRTDVVYGFGHGHLGLTQAAATAELIADIIDDTTPKINLRPFQPNRF